MRVCYCPASSQLRTAREKRLLRIYVEANAQELSRGRTWYETARLYVCELSERFGFTYEVAAGVLAVLSPSTTWEANKADARRVLGYVRHGGNWQDCSVSTYSRNKLKAFTIAETGDCSYVNGPKVRAFWRNILGDYTVPAIDSHALNAYVGFYMVGSAAPTPSVILVRECTQGYIKASERVDESPASLQAIVWLVWKRLISEGKVKGYARKEGKNVKA